MEEQTKKLVIDLDANTQEFDRKIQDSLAKLRGFEEELPKFDQLLKGMGNSFKSFGGEIFDWTSLINNNGRVAITETSRVFDDIEKLQAKGFQALEINTAKFQARFDSIKMEFNPFHLDGDAQLKAFIYLFEKLGDGILTSADNLRKRVENIKLKIKPFEIDAPENQKSIESFFKKLEVEFGKNVENTSAFGTIKELISAGIKNSLNLGYTLPQTLENSKNALTTFWTNYGNIFKSTKGIAKVEDKIVESMEEGKTFDKGLAAVDAELKKSIEFWTPIYNSSFKLLTDTLYLGLQSITGPEKERPDFGIQFRKLLASFMTSIGDTLIQQASKMFVIQAKLTAAMSQIGTPAGWVAIAGLMALGIALKAGGAAMTKTANKQLNPNGMAGNNGMMTTGQNMAPSYAMQRQQSSSTTNESVLRGSDVYWAGQRYEVIRNF
jgi:hypothetical protein